MVSEDNFLEFSLKHQWGTDIYQRDTLTNGTVVEIWDSGVIVFTPADPGPLDLVLSCAVHGDETAPIEICDDLIERLRAGALSAGNRVMFLIANPAAVNLGKRFVDENMNRLFNGAHSRGDGLVNKERKRAKELEDYMARFYTEAPDGPRQRLHYDMHTAIRDSQHEKFAVYPFTHGKPYKKHQLQLLAAMGVEAVLLHEGPTTTFSYASVNRFGADAFTVELGKVRPFGENDMHKFRAVQATLVKLISNQVVELGDFNPDQHHIYQVLRSINRTQQDFELNFPGDVANFTEFEVGYELARDGKDRYLIETPGEAIIFPNAKVALGQRALLTVVEISPDQIKLV